MQISIECFLYNARIILFRRSRYHEARVHILKRSSANSQRLDCNQFYLLQPNAWNREEQLSKIYLQTKEQQSGMFAPDLSFHDGLFYMTCMYTGLNTISEITGTIFTAADPFDDDAWSVPSVWEAPYRTVDPDLLWDDDETAYLTWSGMEKPDHRSIHRYSLKHDYHMEWLYRCSC
jgi:hypothetical protein